MARAVHRRSVTWVAVFAVLLAMLASGTGRAAAAAPGCPWVSQPVVTPGATPVLFVHGINSGPSAWARGAVGGTGESPLHYVLKSLGSGKVAGYTFNWSRYAGGQGNPVLWVTSPLPTPLGAALSQAIACVARKAGHQVIIIAHSMGGLITQFASSLVRADIAAVFTLGTPYQGSWLASAVGGQGPAGGLDLAAQVIRTACGFQVRSLLCTFAAEQHDPGVEAMRLDPAGGWKALPAWPAGFPVYSLAGSITGTWQPVWPLNIQVPLIDAGDTVVGASSQRAAWPGMTLSCPVRLGLGTSLGTPAAVSILDVLDSSPCFHWNEPDTPALLDYIITQVKPMLPTADVPEGAAACAPAAITTALAAANPQLSSYGWRLESYACQSGWAVAQIYAPAVGNGTAFLQQTSSGWNSDGLGEVNCSQIPGPLATPLPPHALAVSLLGKAGICATASASMPDLYLHTPFTFGLYKSPYEPTRIGIDNSDYITGLQWAAASQDSLGAAGTLHYDNCQPDCASGTYITYPIRILASDPQRCPVKLHIDSSQAVQEYVFNKIDITPVTGSPPSYLVGYKPLSPACGGGFT